jgi:hypothetical protein
MTHRPSVPAKDGVKTHLPRNEENPHVLGKRNLVKFHSSRGLPHVVFFDRKSKAPK